MLIPRTSKGCEGAFSLARMGDGSTDIDVDRARHRIDNDTEKRVDAGAHLRTACPSSIKCYSSSSSLRYVLYSCVVRVFVYVHVCDEIRADELLVEKERVRNLTEEIEQTVQEIQGS